MPATPDQMIADDAANFYADPLGFVMWAFEWGVGVLSGFTGPDTWQREFLLDVGRQVRARRFDGVHPVDPIQAATSSGHGIGKSALTAWLVLWIMSTRPHCQGVVTANTGPQLESKTWARLAEWRERCITGHWFSQTTGKGSLKLSHKQFPETWRCDGQTCREELSEAFAGLHAATSTPFYIFDEASAVPDKIWAVAEGGLTDGEPMWFAFGNPTRNDGRFFQCFNALRHRWTTRQIDSRTAALTNKVQIDRWIADYGEDSDFVRVRVRGVFPRAGSMQFIDSETVEAAASRPAIASPFEPLVIGVDVARQGEDRTVIYVRKGRDGRTHEPIKLRVPDLMTIAGRVAQEYQRFQADAVFVDQDGMGYGVLDRLRQLKVPCIGISNGAKADRVDFGEDKIAAANKGAEMWNNMRGWLKGGAIPNDPELKIDLTGRQYGFNARNEIQLESKEDMKERGLASPDIADALALTFAYPVMPNARAGHEGAHRRGGAVAEGADYDPFEAA